MEYRVDGWWRFTVRMRPTSTWTAPPRKMLQLTVPPHGTEASSSLLRFEPQKEWRNARVEEPRAQNLN